MDSLIDYIKQVLIALDQIMNALLGGSADETLSSRAYRTEQKNRMFGVVSRPCIDLLFFFQKQHCYKAYLSEVNRRQLPIEFRE